MTTDKFNLTEGSILQKLVTLSIPIMATAFMEMAFNLTDMFWLGRLDAGSVAAAGAGGLFLWLSMSLLFIGRLGAEIGVSQNIHRDEAETAKRFTQNSFLLAILLGTAYASIMIIFRSQMISFFAIDDPQVVRDAEIYLAITALTIPLVYSHNVITGAFNGFGNTRLPFYIDSFCLGLNIIFSPILIFVFDLGVAGAAWGTVFANIINITLKLIAIKHYKNRPFEHFAYFARPALRYLRQIIRWGLPVGIESALFASLFMVVSRLVAGFGVGAIAAQQVGSQIEGLSWLVAGGFASAITAFVGQNFGAKKYARLRAGYRIATICMVVYGSFLTLLLFFFAEPLIAIFLYEPEYIQIGADYLRVFAAVQITFCAESVVIGFFRGKGQTHKPTIVSVSCNILRVIFAYTLAQTTLGINGIWLGIAASILIRNSWLLIWHRLHTRKMPKNDILT
ncbi:MAG: MATE family efflux transporter [Defluviitaleaceae bacterium]|nr:MATE family efflux transporter [Defluviitaleaceae bacterium]